MFTTISTVVLAIVAALSLLLQVYSHIEKNSGSKLAKFFKINPVIFNVWLTGFLKLALLCFGIFLFFNGVFSDEALTRRAVGEIALGAGALFFFIATGYVDARCSAICASKEAEKPK